HREVLGPRYLGAGGVERRQPGHPGARLGRGGLVHGCAARLGERGEQGGGGGVEVHGGGGGSGWQAATGGWRGLTSGIASIPTRPYARPGPDCLAPPNGASRWECRPCTRTPAERTGRARAMARSWSAPHAPAERPYSV